MTRPDSHEPEPTPARTQEDLFRTLVQTIPDLVWLKDTAGVYLACNPAFERFFGASEAEIVGRTDHDFVDAGLADFFRAHDALAIEAGRPSRNEETLTFAADGTQGVFETVKTPMRDASGQPIGVLGISRDISALVHAEARLKASEELLRTLIDAMPDIVCFKDGEGRWLLANQFDLSLFQLEGVDYQGKTDAELAAYSPFYREALLGCEASDERAWQAGAASRMDEAVPRPDGTMMIFDVIKVPTFLPDGRRKGLIVVGRDITERKQAEQRLQHLAHHDPLTRLPNRVLLTDRLQMATSQSQRLGKLLAVCYLDLDGFKPINDQHGKAVGNQLLIEVAHRLSGAVRAGDSVARLGGDEFVFLLGDLASEAECRVALDRVLEVLAEPCRVEAGWFHLTASIGVTLYPLDATDSDSLLRHADRAMYEAKEAGRNRYHFYDPERDQRMRDARAAQMALQAGLERGEMCLHYQPKVDMRRGTVIGVEALIRWRHPAQGLRPPADFLPEIADTDLIIDLDHWVIGQALAQATAWRRAGLPLCASVNVTARTLSRADFHPRLAAALAAHPELPRQCLEIEILESVAVDDIERVSEIVDQCRALGVGFALDDFGTGYSSLLYLRHLPAGILKIDQSFVRDMQDDPGDLAIVEGIIGLAEAFQRQVIAEGVETEAHGTLLLQLGCEHAQGYGIARPMPAEQIPDWCQHYRQPAAWRPYASLRGAHPDVALLLMAIEHRRWVARVAGLIESHDPEAIARAHLDLCPRDCRFGRWFQGTGLARFGHREAFQALRAEHDALHTLADRLVSLCQQGQPGEAARELPALYAARDRLLERMAQLPEA
ncbi:MAG: EAL domain-containing protein [Pseudomonadota bacterium]